MADQEESRLSELDVTQQHSPRAGWDLIENQVGSAWLKYKIEVESQGEEAGRQRELRLCPSQGVKEKPWCKIPSEAKLLISYERRWCLELNSQFSLHSESIFQVLWP